MLDQLCFPGFISNSAMIDRLVLNRLILTRDLVFFVFRFCQSDNDNSKCHIVSVFSHFVRLTVYVAMLCCGILAGYGQQVKHTALDAVFGGQLISSVTCEECNHVSVFFSLHFHVQVGNVCEMYFW